MEPILGPLTLVSAPFAALDARYRVRTALRDHGLDHYAADAAAVASALVANAVVHTSTQKIGLELTRQHHPEALAVTVTDSSPEPPIRLPDEDISVFWHGLQIIEAHADRWGWEPRGAGKAVYAILTRRA